MKKYIFYTLATVVTFLTFSCSKDTEVQTPDKPVPVDPIVPTEKSVVLSGDVDATKVSSDNNGAYKWQASDIITILTDNGTNREFTAGEAGISTDFSGHIPDADALEGGFAIYPASENHSISGTTITFNMPSELAWGADASYMPMYAPITMVEQKPSASFKAVGGALKLILYNIPSGATYLAFTAASVNIAGNFSLDTTAETPVISEGKSKEIDINFSDNYSANKVFYIPLPPVTLTGGFTISIFDDEANELFSVTSTKGITIGRNKLVIAPALNCASSQTLWSEDFTGYAADAQPSSKGSVNYAYGEDGTKVYTTQLASGGVEGPELLIKSGNGTFTVSNIPTGGATSMTLTFKTNRNLTLSTTTDGISGLDNISSDGNARTVSISNTKEASIFDIEFKNTLTNNARIDDIKLVIPPTSATTPVITSGDVNLTIAVGSLSKSTSVGISNPVDGLGLQYVLSKSNDKPIDWVNSVAIANGSLTVTATGANGEAEDRVATLTLKATGATNKVINLKQTSALVAKPASISVVPGNASFSASWTKANHASSYLAYLCASSGLADPTTGTSLTPSLDGTTYSVSASGLTNGTTYYLYVKVNGVETNYIADSGWQEVSVTPNDNTVYYEKVTAALSDYSGTYLIVDEAGKVATGAWNSTSGLKATDVTISNGKIAKTNTVDQYAVSIQKIGNTSNYTVYFDETELYLGYSSGNSCQSYGSTSEDNTSWTISIVSKSAILTSVSTSDRILRRNTGVTDANGPFRCYSTATGNYAVLYKLEDDREAAGLAWKEGGVAADSDGATMLTGDDTMPTISLDNPNSLTVSYSSSDAAVATINSSTGVLTLVSAGTTTISATFDGDATYKPQTASYTLTVTDSRTACVTPTFEPGASALTETTNVTISSTTTGSTIYYTTDGSTPTTSSSHGTAGAASATVSVTAPMTVKAIAVKTDYKNSEVGSAAYTSSSGPEDLSTPGSISITDIDIAGKKFSGSWASVSNASSYDWVVSTAANPNDIAAGNTKASGNTTSTSFTTTALGDSYKPAAGTVYYLHVRAVGDGVSYATSDYGTAHAIIYQHVFNAKPSTGNGIALSTIQWNISATNLGSYNSANYAGVQFGTSKANGAISLTSTSNWGSQNSTSYYGYSTVKKVTVWANRGGKECTPSVTIGGMSASGSGTIVKNSSAGNDYTKASKVVFTPAANGTSGTVVIALSSVNAGYICAIEVLSE